MHFRLARILTNASQQIADSMARLRLEPAVLAQVEATEGSAQCDTGSWMAVT
jgi:xanthine/CO dehydrogenase XdhC/CoxF family maturation factor